MKPEEKTTFYIVRHGQSLVNAFLEAGERNFDNEQFGELQAPLSDKGKKQAKELASKLKSIHFDAACSSDLNRARETAEILVHSHGLAITTESTIRERFFGTPPKGVMTNVERLDLEHALEVLNDEEKLLYRYYPDGETGMEAVSRLMTFLKKVRPLYKGKTVLVVNHGNVMRSMLIHLKWAAYKDLPAGTIDNCAYFVLETDGKQFSVTQTSGIHKRKLAANTEE